MKAFAADMSPAGKAVEDLIEKSEEAESLPLHGEKKSLRKFLRRGKCGLKELANAVEEVLNLAFATLIQPQQQQDAPVCRAFALGHRSIPTTSFLSSAYLKNSNRETIRLHQCSPPPSPVQQTSPTSEASPTGGS